MTDKQKPDLFLKILLLLKHFEFSLQENSQQLDNLLLNGIKRNIPLLQENPMLLTKVNNLATSGHESRSHHCRY
jgi:hypothetical protein